MYQVLKKFPCHSNIIPVTDEGKPKRQVGAGWVRVPRLLCRRWIPVQGGMCWPSFFSTIPRASFSPSASSPRAPSTRPQSRMHPCGVCSTPATERRGEHAVPRASASLHGARQWRRREGGMERFMNQLRIGLNTNPRILYFI